MERSKVANASSQRKQKIEKGTAYPAGAVVQGDEHGNIDIPPQKYAMGLAPYNVINDGYLEIGNVKSYDIIPDKTGGARRVETGTRKILKDMSKAQYDKLLSVHEQAQQENASTKSTSKVSKDDDGR